MSSIAVAHCIDVCLQSSTTCSAASMTWSAPTSNDPMYNRGTNSLTAISVTVVPLGTRCVLLAARCCARPLHSMLHPNACPLEIANRLCFALLVCIRSDGDCSFSQPVCGGWPSLDCVVQSDGQRNSIRCSHFHTRSACIRHTQRRRKHRGEFRRP